MPRPPDRHRRAAPAAHSRIVRRLRPPLSHSLVPGRTVLSRAGRERRSRRGHLPSTGWRTPSSLRATGCRNAEQLTSADSNHIAPRRVPSLWLASRGFVGSTAAWQPLSADSLYPATESARPRSREPHKIRVISARLSFWEGQASFTKAGGTPIARSSCSTSATRPSRPP